MVNPEDWQNDWKTDMTAFARELKEVAAAYDFQVSEKTRLSPSLEATVTESGHLEQTIGKIQELNPGWKERLSDEAYAFNGRILDAAGMLLAESVSLEDRKDQNLSRRAEAEKALKILSENEAWTDEFPDTESIILKIKETDRMAALICEMRKLGYILQESEGSILSWEGERCERRNEAIDTYEDHRMAMAFAPACLVMPHININNPQVVSKSYPHYWDDLKAAGFIIKEV